MRFTTLFLCVCLAAVSHAEEPRFEVLFNGEDLSGWKGLDGFWRVEDKTIIGETTDDRPTKANTFLIWQGGEVGDFEFRCLVRFQGNNSGVQYRSAVLDEAGLALSGYQADLHPKPENFGMLYSEKTGRGIIANRGKRLTVGADGKPADVVAIDAAEALEGEDWNELRIVAVGNRMIHQVNRVTTIDVTDHHKDAATQGLLGLQLHRGPAMKVEFRNLLLRKLKGDEGQTLIKKLADETKLAGGQAEATSSDRDLLAEGPKPSWIWAKKAGAGQRVWFRHEFDVAGDVSKAQLYASCDNHLRVRINGKNAGRSDDWGRPIESDVAKHLRPGKNVVMVEAWNDGGPAGLVFKLSVVDAGGSVSHQVSNQEWRLVESAKAPAKNATWLAASKKATLGDQPWGLPRAGASKKSQQAQLNPRRLLAPPGFEIERVHSVTQDQGSWVSLATDPAGRIYACDQGGAGLYRVTIREDDSPLVEKVSQGSLADVSGAQGLLWAFDSLWFHRNGGNLYRLYDSDGDDRLDAKELIPSTRGGGEHGNHAVILTEDGSGIYMDGGNHAPLAEHTGTRVPMWHEGLLLPRMWDARGHARGVLSPGGWVTRLDPVTNEQTVVSVGYRNQYDIALNRFGELFTYDADMEWDLGLPWYRPTRICLVTSGSEYGWRSGSGKWPTYYEDSLPPVVEIGPGSPTGVSYGAGTKFPTRYQDAMFALDWTFGTIYAIHLQPNGAGYKGEAEPFVVGAPLPVTDAVVGHDGHLYFAIGGRGTVSGLFRVKYVGNESTAKPTSVEPTALAARELRRKLESYHGKADEAAISFAWPHLASEDRFIRYAARLAIESQPVSSWRDRVAGESHPQAKITASVALGRMGEETDKDVLVDGLLSLNPKSLGDNELLGLLRAYALGFIELGGPDKTQRAAVSEQLDSVFPHANADCNTELVRVLTYLGSPSVIEKTMELIEKRPAPALPDWSELARRNPRYGAAIEKMLDNHPPTREIGYAFMLRNLRRGWSIDQRRAYFEFLNEAAKASGGASYTGYLGRIRDEALGNCSNEERVALEDVTGEDFNPQPDFAIHEPVGPGKKWTLEETLSASRGKADYENGRSLYFSAKCASCHRLAGLGGNIGPDLTSVPNKFDLRYLAEAIVHPSKHISDQYGSSRVLTADGRILTGLVIEGDDGGLTVYPIDVDGKEIRLSADDVELVEPSKVSQMPEALLDRLNASEIRDLLAYVMSAGRKDDKRFSQ